MSHYSSGLHYPPDLVGENVLISYANGVKCHSGWTQNFEKNYII